MRTIKPTIDIEEKVDADQQKAYDDLQKAYDDLQKAYAVWRKAFADQQNADAVWQKIVDPYHSELCPDCPWDGETIFPEYKK